MHDGSRKQVAFPGPGEEPEEIGAPARRLGLRELRGGLPDDSHDEDEERTEHAQTREGTCEQLAQGSAVLCLPWDYRGSVSAGCFRRNARGRVWSNAVLREGSYA